MSLFSKIGKAITNVVRPVTSAVGAVLQPILGGRGGSGVVSQVRPPPPRKPPVSADVSLIRDFADVILKYDDSDDYTNKAVRCADYVKRPAPPEPKKEPKSPPPKKRYNDFDPIDRWVDSKRRGTSGLRVAYKPFWNERPDVSVLQPQIHDVPNVSKATRGSRARVNLFGFMDEVLAFASQAKNAGFDPPDNPFVEISRLNSLRNRTNVEVPVSQQEASDLLFNIQAYVDLLEAQAAGAINLQTGVFNAAQLEHISLSYTGLGGTGNTAADLMRLLPNADELKTKKAQDALSVLNFGKRLPHVVFVAEYNPNQVEGDMGALIGWKKMADAAGYIIKRHSVIGNEDVQFEVTNEDVIKNQRYMEYARAYVLTFYDKIKADGVCLFLDSNPPIDDYCIYKVQAYQLKKESATSIIPSNFISMNLSTTQKLALNSRIKELDPVDIEAVGEETISPWPVIAEQMLGDASLDWILAAANIRNSIDAKEEKAISRKHSYLNAHMKFLIDRADQGKLVRPTSIDDVRLAVSNAIQTYGISQTIEALLQETGVLYYFDGRDSREDTVFDRAGTEDIKTSGVVGAVASAIDPESATIDLRNLATNMASILSDGKLEDYTTTLEMAAKKAEGAKPEEINIDPDVTSDTSAESGIQFVATLGEMADTSVDLTTFDGISKMMRVIRVMSDFGPKQNAPTRPPRPRPAPPPRPSPTDDTAPTSPRPAPPRPVLGNPDAARDSGRPALAERLERLEEVRSRNTRNETGPGRRRYEP